MSGPNFLRHDCEKHGCFNKKRRPKIERFFGCFPRGINFGDVDGLVELAGAFCLLEWKGEGGTLKTAQRIAYEAFVRLSERNVVFVVSGCPESMEVSGFTIIRLNAGRAEHRHAAGTFDDLRTRVQRWSDWVQSRSAA